MKHEVCVYFLQYNFWYFKDLPRSWAIPIWLLGVAPTSICHFFHPSVRPSVRRAPYLRSRTSSNHNFWYIWYTSAKWWFHFFEIFIFRTVTGVKGQKIAQNEKWQLHSSRTMSQEQYSMSWFSFFLKFSFFGLLGR